VIVFAHVHVVIADREVASDRVPGSGY